MRKFFTLLTLLSTGWLISGVHGQNVPEILYYQFDGSGTSVPNNASAPPTGTSSASIVGSLSQGSNGLCGGALIGVGGSSSTNYVNTGWNTNLGTGAWTIMFWTDKIPNNTTLHYQFGDNSASSFRCFNNGVAGAGNWMLRGPVTDVLCTGCAPVGNHKSMTTFVYDPTAGNIKAYKNDTLINTVSQSTLNISGSAFKVGGYSSSTGMGSGELMDEFRFYSRALDQNEITLVYNQCLPLSSAPNDAGVKSIDEPVNFCADTLDVKATIRNGGTAQLDSCMVNWSINGVAQTPVNFQGVLDTLNGTGPTDTMLTLGNSVFNAGVPYTIRVWTSMPNGVADTVNFNDTLEVTVQAAISGTYNIGGPTPDYASFTDAVTDLTSYGVCGPTVFMVHDSMFNEQLDMTTITGASATNTITFMGTGPNSGISYAPISSAATATIMMSGASYVTFRDLMVLNTAATYRHTVRFYGGSDWNTFDGCLLQNNIATSTSSNYANIYSISSVDNNNTFMNCTIENGSYGIYWYGSGTTTLESGSVFMNNHFLNQYYYGARLYYQEDLTFEGNVIESNSGYTGTSYGIYGGYCDGATRMIGNEVRNDQSLRWPAYGMYFFNWDGTPVKVGLIANNMISNGQTTYTGTQYTCYMSNCGYQDVVNNSFSSFGGSTTSNRGLYITGGGAITVLNNIFSAENGYGFYFNSGFAVTQTDYNNFFTPTANAGYFNGAQASLTDWQTATGMGANSIAVDPQFKNASSDLHVCGDSIDGMGTPSALVANDFDGQMRDANSPDIGADEFTPLSQGFLGPDVSFCTGDSILLVGGSGQDTTVWSTGDTTNSLWITTGGTYSATINGACGNATDNITVTEAGDVYTGFLEADTTTACEGDTITLSSNSTYDTYSWSSGGSGQTEQVTTSGTYTLDVTDNCGAGQESVTVSFIPTPVANFTHTTSFLTGVFTDGSTTGGNSTWAWDFGDGSGTSSLQSPSYIYASGGTYVVTLTVSNECGSDTYTDTVTVTVVGLEDDLASNVNVYPNPSNGNFQVAMDFDQATEVRLTVMSLQGQNIYQKEIGLVQGVE